MNYSDQLQNLREQQLYRERVVRTSKVGRYVSINGKQLLNFNCNDYLDLSAHPALIIAATNASQKLGFGSTGSPLMSGYTSLHQELEFAMASFLGYDKAVLFSTGYMANLGIAQALLNKDDVLVEDKLNHASLIDGALIARAQLKRYSHLNYDKAEEALALKGNKNALLASDGIFSMDGDSPDLRALSVMAQTHDALLWVDDAHGVGMFGDSGRGTVEAQGLNKNNVPLLSGTFGKAFGSSGAYAVGSNEVIDTIIQKARTYKFNTSMPVATIAANLKALEIIQSESWRREKVLDLIHYYKEQVVLYDLEHCAQESDTAIQPFVLGSEEATLEKAAYLLDRGIFVSAIRPPTVAKNQCRLRFTLTAALEKEDIDLLVQCLIGNY
ncbi:aminotransferase class I/II-fold pyridoxal phosphate-dependent enzyme [Marinicella rhabdoformis]|uniref:aminotransferase class I/II-fold pyridoxal phosphate-dependent enzyme n=1 Tax=Marinicella rhabdoformis TaxID=2580566 RepID=UPI0012AED962|nr:8-amino-7-oxononanoate synthase [Marinicella rhabdoformis]